MKTRKSALLALFLVLFQSCYGLKNEEQQDDSEVVYAIILYRHGERTPEVPYANDPYKDDSYWPIGWGQLTNTGKRQHYELGKWLRNKYESLMRDGKYSHNLTYVRASDFDRCLMSAQSNLAGMFPQAQRNNLGSEWDNLRWEPIPIHTIPRELDELLALGHPCPKYHKYLEEFYNSGIMKSFNKRHQKLYDYLTLHTGELVKDPTKVQYLYSTLYIQTLNNYTLPPWVQEQHMKEMYDISAFGFQMPSYTTMLKRLLGGPLLKQIIEHMKAKISGELSPNRNLWIYSAHDTTVSTLLQTMGVFDVHNPPFAATVMVDLTKKNDQYYVSVYYKNSTEAQLLTIPGCSALCPLDEFEKVLTDVIPQNWDLECKMLLTNSVYDHGYSKLDEYEARNIRRYITSKVRRYE